jgi:excisionase family DNA binding protein
MRALTSTIGALAVSPHSATTKCSSCAAKTPRAPFSLVLQPTNMHDAISANQKLAYQIPEACEAAGVCRSKLYQLIKSGQLPVRKLGKRTLILASDLKQLVESLPLGGGTARTPIKQKQKQSQPRAA